jgi:hypothetical protein
MAELPEDCVIMLPDEFVACDLVGALEALWKDPGRRAHMGEMAREWVRQHHHPARVGEIYRDVIEVCAAHAPSRRYPTLLTDIAKEYCDAGFGTDGNRAACKVCRCEPASSLPTTASARHIRSRPD